MRSSGLNIQFIVGILCFSYQPVPSELVLSGLDIFCIISHAFLVLFAFSGKTHTVLLPGLV